MLGGWIQMSAGKSSEESKLLKHLMSMETFE